jgi:hypothetical protein
MPIGKSARSSGALYRCANHRTPLPGRTSSTGPTKLQIRLPVSSSVYRQIGCCSNHTNRCGPFRARPCRLVRGCRFPLCCRRILFAEGRFFPMGDDLDRQNHRQNQAGKGHCGSGRRLFRNRAVRAQIVQGKGSGRGRGNGRVSDHGCSFDDGCRPSLTLTYLLPEQIGKNRRALPDDDALTIAQGIPSVGAAVHI